MFSVLKFQSNFVTAMLTSESLNDVVSLFEVLA